MMQKKADYILLCLSFLLCFMIYYKIDYGISLEYNFFPWDGFFYNKIAEVFDFKNFNIKPQIQNLHGPHAFFDRILFPISYKSLSLLLDINLINSALFVNLAGTLLSFICFVILAKNYKINSAQIIFSSIIFMIFWGGPLRSSINNPSASFGFETGLISLLCLCYILIEKKNYQSRYLTFLTLILIILCTLQRGVVIIAILFLPVLIDIFSYAKKKIIPWKILIIKFFFFLVSCFTFTILKIYLVSSNEFFLIKSIIKYSYFNLNIVNFLYPFFVFIGPFFLFFSIFLFTKNFSLKEKIFLINTKINSKIFFTILFFSIFISKIAGDPDRPMLWFWNYYLLLGIISYNLIKKNYLIKIIFLIITVLWSRPFIPSQVPLVFSKAFVDNSFVTTNFDYKFFRGPNILKKYRNNMETVALQFGSPYESQYHRITKQNATIVSGKYDLDCFGICASNKYVNSHRYQINNIPFPLGYIHNQKDALVDHPLLGKPWVLYCLTLQWIVITVTLILVFNKKLK